MLPHGGRCSYSHRIRRRIIRDVSRTFLRGAASCLGVFQSSGYGWFQFEAADRGITEFFGITESAAHIANENRIAFWAESPADVDRLAQVVTRAGARSIEGPMQYITLFSLKILAAIAWRSAIAPGMRLKPSNPYEGSQMR